MTERNTARFEMVAIERLENNAWNPNALDQAGFDRLVQEIGDVGLIDPLQVVPLKGGQLRIIGGEHRAAAARELGLAEVPVMVLEGPRWRDEDLQKLVTVRLNVIKGKLNPSKMAMLYNEMAKKYGEEALQSLFAFTDKHAWDQLVSGIKQGLSKTSLPKEKRKEFDDKVKEAKTLKDLERILNELWSSYGDTVQQSFMIFTYGKREHIYVSMTKETRTALKKVGAYCKDHAKDINTVLGPAITALADVLAKKAKTEPKTEPEQDDVAY